MESDNREGKKEGPLTEEEAIKQLRQNPLVNLDDKDISADLSISLDDEEIYVEGKITKRF